MTKDIFKQVTKKYGEIILDPKEILEKNRSIFSLSPKLDIALSGGIPSGCWGIVSGLSKLGKSTLALSICAQAQQEGRLCIYHDVECRLEKKNLEGIPGLDTDPEKLKIIKSTQGNILTAEKHLAIAEEFLKNIPGIVLVLDSSSALCATKEYDSNMEDQMGRNDGPRLLAKFTRKLAQIVPTQDATVVIIQHMIANTSGYGSPWQEDGGNKIFYQSDFKLRGVSFKKWEEGDKQIGQVNNWHIITSALGQPGSKVESYLKYGEGIDSITELIELACDAGIITKGGAWYNLDFIEDGQKIQGIAKVKKFFQDPANQDLFKLLKDNVREFYIEG